jgi:hypothetical protein
VQEVQQTPQLQLWRVTVQIQFLVRLRLLAVAAEQQIALLVALVALVVVEPPFILRATGPVVQEIPHLLAHLKVITVGPVVEVLGLLMVQVAVVVELAQ